MPKPDHPPGKPDKPPPPEEIIEPPEEIVEPPEEIIEPPPEEVWPMGHVINVKDDFGATGDGQTNDTAAIQAALDAAFGPFDNPHGGLGDVGSPMYGSRPVYFPCGYYNLESPVAARPITGAVAGDSNPIDPGYRLVRLTIDTTGLMEGELVNVKGVEGTIGANGSFHIHIDDDTHLSLYGSRYDADYIGGGALTNSALKIRSGRGGWIFGAGRFTTNLRNVTPDGSLLSTNGFDYTRIENFNFACVPGMGACLDLSWQAPETTGNFGSALQSNTIINVSAGGGCDYACRLGVGGNMGSEHTFLNCYFSGLVAGLKTCNYNACDNIWLGGDFAGCGIGIYVQSGSVNTIHGVSFQNGSGLDISVENGADDAYSIAGCRSESEKFLMIGADQPFNISGCNQTNGNKGFFVSGAGHVTINSCSSIAGSLRGNMVLTVKNSKFHRPDYLDDPEGTFTGRYLEISPMPSKVVTDASRLIMASDAGHKLLCGNETTLTLRKATDTSLRLEMGAYFEVQQMGTGQATITGVDGVTIRSAGGAKTRTQYSVMRVNCDGPDTWTITGDTAA